MGRRNKPESTRLINKIKKNKNEITLNNTKIYYYTLDKEDNIERLKAAHYFTENTSSRENHVFNIEHTDSTISVNHVNIFISTPKKDLNIHVIPSELKEEFERIIASQS